MKYANTTSVPNYIFDSLLPHLSIAEIKVLMIIIRQTIGWKDVKSTDGRKCRDWISSIQLQNKTGCSRRAISTAINHLVSKGLIVVSGFDNSTLSNPEERKGKSRLYFQLKSTSFRTVENKGKITEISNENFETNAKNAQYLCNEITKLGQHLHITKETHTK
ncbi:MAG: replication protein [Bacteroidetes bacterium]|nr:replication protein [Bacteroidota bacterium]